MVKYVVFLGKPGSGKGTQAQYFSRYYGGFNFPPANCSETLEGEDSSWLQSGRIVEKGI